MNEINSGQQTDITFHKVELEKAKQNLIFIFDK